MIAFIKKIIALLRGQPEPEVPKQHYRIKAETGRYFSKSGDQ